MGEAMREPLPAVAFTHVHSFRIANGEEALAARVRLADGTIGHGFTLNLEAIVARDMAAWDALARSRGVPVQALFAPFDGAADESAGTFEILPAGSSALVLDPWALQTLEDLHAAAAVAPAGYALLAPNSHPWELDWCATVAASLQARLPHGPAGIVSNVSTVSTVRARRGPGVGMDWTLEPGFAQLHWQT